MSRHRFAAMFAAVVAAALPTAAIAVVTWTLTAQPLTADAGQAQVFNLQATNLSLLSEIGCVTVVVPSSFTIQSTEVTSTSNGQTWVASYDGGTARVQSSAPAGRLGLSGWVRFAIRALPNQAGLWTWHGTAYPHESCSGVPLLGVLPLAITVLPSAAPTLTPSLSPLPTVPPLPTLSPVPSLPTNTPNPRASPGPGSPQPSPSTGPGPGGVAPGPSAGQGGGALAIPPQNDLNVAGLGIDALALLGDGQVWFVPAFVLSVPGLLVILAIALQMIGGLAWLPLMRRTMRRYGEDPPQRGY